jgi:hypothetical protein
LPISSSCLRIAAICSDVPGAAVDVTAASAILIVSKITFPVFTLGV